MKASTKTTNPTPPRRRRVGKRRGGKGGWEPRATIVARLERALTLNEQGWTQAAIAEDVGVSQAAVSKMLQRADVQAVAAIDQELTTLKARRLRMLEYVSRESRRAWEESKKGRVRRRQRKAAGAGSDAALTQEVLIDEHPDPRMLDQARKAEEAMADVCGLTGSGRGATASEALPVPELTAEEIAARLNALLDELERPAAPVTAGVAAPTEAKKGGR